MTSVSVTSEDAGNDLERHFFGRETHSLDDPAYRDFMLQLQEQGHEIAFHGGNPRKHRFGMCKKEGLAVEEMNPASPYYVWDIIKHRIRCVWAFHDLLDGDFSIRQSADLFYERE